MRQALLKVTTMMMAVIAILMIGRFTAETPAWFGLLAGLLFSLAWLLKP